MEAPSDDPEPPSAVALTVLLARAEAAGLIAAHDAYGPDLVGYAEFLLAGRPAPDGAGHPAEEAAAAVLDALLVAAGTAGDLTDPTRMRAWLVALTRNECLRRRPGPGAPTTAEAAELGRRGVSRGEVSALLGYAPAELPARQGAPETVPAWLCGELVAAAGAAGAGRRAELTRRARPFEPDGFPVPLDRRRLSRSALAWSAVVVVVIALGLLLALPTPGDAGALARQVPLLAAASAVVAPADTPQELLPTLADTPFATTSPVPDRPEPAADRGVARSTPVPSSTATATPRGRTDAGAAGRLSLTWTEQPGGCGDEWTARLHATAAGADVGQVVAVGGARTVVLRPDGDGWSGDLTGLPTDRGVTVTVWATGGVRPASERLTSTC